MHLQILINIKPHGCNKGIIFHRPEEIIYNTIPLKGFPYSYHPFIFRLFNPALRLINRTRVFAWFWPRQDF